MNLNDEDVDLGLALGSTYYSARTQLNSSSGAGVNADSRVDMAFAASDPLSELVWSPDNGLSLKCADSSLSNKKPFGLWKVGLSMKDPLASQDIRSKGSGEEKEVEKKLTLSHTMLEADVKFSDKASMLRSSGGNPNAGCNLRTEEGGTADAILEENTGDNGREGPSSSHIGQIADIAECSKMNAEQDILADGSEVNMEMKRDFSSKTVRRPHCNPMSRLEFVAVSNEIIGSADPVNSEPHVAKLCEASRLELDEEVTSSSRNTHANKTRKPIAVPAPNLTILESSAENDLGHLTAKEVHSSGETRLHRKNSCLVDRSPSDSRIRLYQEKGKAKALSEGNIYGRSDDEDDSNESMESCNSAGLFSKGIKRQSYDQEQLVGSKRLKKQIQASHGSAYFVRPDSSFMNWISNMVKGISDSNKEGSSLSLTLARSNDACGNDNREDIACNKPQDYESPKVGFQSMFQSLYCRNTKIPLSGVPMDDCSIGNAKGLMVADKISLENAPQLCNNKAENPCKQIILCNKEPDRHVSRNIVGEVFSADFASPHCACGKSLGENKASCFPACDGAKGEAAPFNSSRKGTNGIAEDTILDTPLPIRCMPSKSSPLSSLWITRLYNKAAKLENCDQVAEEAPVCSTEFPTPSVDVKFSDKRCSTQFPQKLRTSEAMTSMFAKRLDAFRHIIPTSEKMKSSTCTQICFFCGSSSHDLRMCPELTEAELDDLLVKISAFDSTEESPSFCIKCFQFDHWASSCPSAILDRHGQSQKKAFGCHPNYSFKLCPLSDGGDEVVHKQVSTGCMAANVASPRKRLSTSNEFQRSTETNSDDELKNIQQFPLFNFITAQNTFAEEEMFHVIMKLRLSRADVLRWMNSNVPLSYLNGFFLRLRLGSFEAGLAGTSYYAARITGDKIESIGCKFNKSISVDVGGIKSSVGSQYVSNQDFLEDEVKAWWARIVKTGGSIPSLDELNSKFEERSRLGF